MNSISKASIPCAVLTTAIAGALAATLVACDTSPSTGRLGNDGERTVQNAKRELDRFPAPAKIDPAGNTVSGKAAESAKADDDTVLAAKVKSALVAEQTLSRSLGIDVAASGGTVTLKGAANNNSDREKAVQVASNVEGVRSVKNDLVVVSGS